MASGHSSSVDTRITSRYWGSRCEMAALPKAQTARPPEKGSFPLDHGGECKSHVQDFLQCLADNNHDHLPCKTLSKRYLKCRMDRNLMAKEEFDKLGFSSEEDYARIRRGVVDLKERKEEKGFVGGMYVKQRGGWGRNNRDVKGKDQDKDN